jgi:CDP-paratose 2-epimerase
VRDVLFIDDLLDAYDLAVEKIDQVAGEVFNIGGGPVNTLSVWSQFGPILERLKGEPIPVKFSTWRPGDQKIYVSDIRRVEKMLNWTPKTDVNTGIEALYNWASENQKVFA